jgi:hypothetical protein
LESAHRASGAYEAEAATRKRLFVLQVIQPGLAGLMDGSVSTLAPLFAAAFATRNPWTKAQKDEYKKEWKDVVQYRTAERGDTIFALDLTTALARHAAAPR